MGQEEQLTHLYTGSQINVAFVKEFLDENAIPSFIRNDMHSGITAGFGAAIPGSETRLFVKKKHFMEARILLDKYLKAREG
ncbi:MAG TPA: DUF2007 domain-containing protein [Bacteroidales bacterium]|nr:DUF2007 domain-containing protein [Bacteroidales bacterium]